MTTEQLLTAAEVVQRLGNKISRQQVYDLFAEGALDGFRVGRKILIRAASLDEYLVKQSNKHQPVNEQSSPPGKKPKGEDYLSYHTRIMAEIAAKTRTGGRGGA